MNCIHGECFEPIFTQIRVCIASILKCRFERFLAMFAIKCASWTSINAGPSRRCPCDAVGFDEFASVSSSNAMLERTFTFKLGFPPCIYIQPCTHVKFTNAIRLSLSIFLFHLNWHGNCNYTDGGTCTHVICVDLHMGVANGHNETAGLYLTAFT